MGAVARALIALLFVASLSHAAWAETSANLSLAAVKASKAFEQYAAQRAKGSRLDLVSAPGADYVSAIFNIDGLAGLPAVHGGDLNALLEWQKAALATYNRIFHFGLPADKSAAQQAMLRNLNEYEDSVATGGAFLVRLSSRLAETAAAFLQALPEQQRNEPTRQQGYAQMKGGVVQTVSGILDYMGEGTLRVANARAVAAALKDTARVWAPFTTSGDRKALLDRLARARNHNLDGAIQDDLLAVSSVISAAQ